MMQNLFLIAVCLVGLGVYVALVRRSPNRSFFPLLGPGIILLGAAGLAMLRLLPIDAAENTARVLVALALLWIGWIGRVAFVVQAIHRRMPGSYPWPTLFGSVVTFSPVLGFLVARAMI